jgi:hypothetical protein
MAKGKKKGSKRGGVDHSSVEQDVNRNTTNVAASTTATTTDVAVITTSASQNRKLELNDKKISAVSDTMNISAAATITHTAASAPNSNIPPEKKKSRRELQTKAALDKKRVTRAAAARATLAITHSTTTKNNMKQPPKTSLKERDLEPEYVAGDRRDVDTNRDGKAIVACKQADLDKVVELQKERAIIQWEQSFSAGYFGETLYRDVLMQLKSGKVPPFFHTFCRDPKDRLFFPRTEFDNEEEEGDDEGLRTKFNNKEGKSDDVSTSDGEKDAKMMAADFANAPKTEFSNEEGNSKDNTSSKEMTTKMISFDAVEVGKASCEVEGTIPSKKEFSYLTAFFGDDAQKARVNVKDSVLPAIPWIFDDEFTELVTDLVNKPAEMKGHDIEVTQLKSAFELDTESGKNLITRSLSRGVVAECFRESRRRSVHAITGNPGIGKSWTLIYTLQQALLYEDVCVMFCFQKDLMALVCIRKDNHIYVWKKSDPAYEFNCVSSLFENSNVLVLLDPTEDGAKYPAGYRRLIFAASNNKKHFKNVFKVTVTFMKILNMLSDDELKIALKYMCPNKDTFSDKQVQGMICRSKIVGNLPRYIFTKERSEILTDKVDVFSRNADPRKLANLFSFRGLSDIEDKTNIPGAIFSLSATFHVFDDGTVDVGYDGNINVDYCKKNIALLSKYAEQKCVLAYRHEILSYLGRVDIGELSSKGAALEVLMWHDLRGKIALRTFKLMSGNVISEETRLVQHDVKELKNAEGIPICPSITELENCVFDPSEKTVCQMKKCCPLIDFAGPGRRVYQVTVSTDHDMSFIGMVSLFQAGGFIQNNGGTISYSEGFRKFLDIANKDESEVAKWKIEFYWTVPCTLQPHWTKKCPKSCPKPKSKEEGTKQAEKIVQTCFEYLEQYALMLDFKPTYQNANEVTTEEPLVK